MQEFLTLLLSKLEAFIPLAAAGQHLETRHITALNELSDFVVSNVHVFLSSLNLCSKDILHFFGSDISCAFHSTIEFFDAQKGVNCLLKHVHRLKNVTSRLELLQVNKPLSKNLRNFVNPAFVEAHSQVETVVVNFLKHLLVAEMALSNFKVSINRLGVVT